MYMPDKYGLLGIRGEVTLAPHLTKRIQILQVVSQAYILPFPSPSHVLHYSKNLYCNY